MYSQYNLSLFILEIRSSTIKAPTSIQIPTEAGRVAGGGHKSFENQSHLFSRITLMKILTRLTVQKREPSRGRSRISSCPYFLRESKSFFSSWNNHHYGDAWEDAKADNG